MRGTLHLLPSAEFPLWQAALSTRRGFESGAWRKAFGVTGEELERLVDAVGEALDGRMLTTIEAFVEPPAWARRAAEAEAERLAAWAGGQLELHWAEAPRS